LEVWWRPKGRSPFSFDPTKPRGPQIFAAVWQSAIIFGGLGGLVFSVAVLPVEIRQARWMHAGVTEKSDDDHDEKNDQPCGSCHEVLSCSTLVCDGLYGLYGLIWSFGEAPGPFVFVDAS
jgi:hypothetical protein